MTEKRIGVGKKYGILFVMIWVAQMAAAFYFCTQKQGFHEDEYYTYYSTARTDGFYVEDGKWMDRDVYRSEFVVLPGKGFQYGLVRLVQSWDVHPPVYYWVFHTVQSLAPGVFSKWTGLCVNLVIHGINIVLLAYMSYLVSGRDRRQALYVVLFWGFSPAAMSGVVFIRMYELLTMFVLLCGILHICAMRKGGGRLSVTRCLLPMAAVTYLGFLTQYYYFIFLFYLGIAFCVWLLRRDRNIWNCLRYIAAHGVAFVLAYLTYPSFPGQMFHGQRGAQATESFFDLSNTFGRIGFFCDLMNRYAFGYLLPVILVLILAYAVVLWRQGKWKRGVRPRMADTGYWVLLTAAAGYFLTVSKTALLLGDTSNRYQIPVYGIVTLLVFEAVRTLRRAVIGDGADGGRYKKIGELAAVFLCCAAVALGYWKGGVLFLYPEDREQTGYAGERAAQNTPAVYLYRQGEEWCIWDVTDELMEYPGIYFAAADSDNMIDDGSIREADSLVVYLARGAAQEEQIRRVLDSNPGLSEYRKVFEEKYCDVYYFD